MNLPIKSRGKFLFTGAFLFFAACTAVSSQSPVSQDAEPVISNTKEAEDSVDDVEELVEQETKDPCAAINAQEAWVSLQNKKPKLGNLQSSEVYFSSQGTKMLAVSQQLREVYGENAKSYVELSAEVAERGSRVVSFSQVVATKPSFVESGELYSSLPPFWQQQIQDPQAVLTIKHHLLGSGAGYVKFENDIVSDLAMRLEHGQELRCRSGEACKCL